MIGGGIVGYNAAVIALGLGAQVTILERSVDRMRHLEEILARPRQPADVVEPPDRGARSRDADVVIGAVLIPGALAPKLVTREMIARDEGGRASSATSRSTRAAAPRPRTPTTHADPVYVVDGVTHYCVANMPGAVPITSTKALTNATLPVRRGDRRPRARRGGRRATRRSRRASTCSTARSRTRRSPRRTASTYTPLEDVLARARV